MPPLYLHHSYRILCHSNLHDRYERKRDTDIQIIARSTHLDQTVVITSACVVPISLRKTSIACNVFQKKKSSLSPLTQKSQAVNFLHYVCRCTRHQTSKLVKNRLECKAEESSARPRGLCDALRDRVRSRKPALRCRLRFNRVTFVGDAKTTPLDEHFNRARRPSRVHLCYTAYVYRAFARFLFREMFSRSFVEHANNEAFFLFGKRVERDF